MSPTSYQAAPPRNLIVTIEWGSVKPEEERCGKERVAAHSGRNFRAGKLPLETHANCDCLIDCAPHVALSPAFVPSYSQPRSTALPVLHFPYRHFWQASMPVQQSDPVGHKRRYVSHHGHVQKLQDRATSSRWSRALPQPSWMRTAWQRRRKPAGQWPPPGSGRF